jgi:hypothetical protein
MTKSIDYEIKYYNAKPFSIDMWYNRHERSWVVRVMDEEGNQIGDATYVYSKSEALDQVKIWKEEYGIPLIRT